MRKVIHKIYLLIYSILLSGCGLEQFVYLAPINKDDILGSKNDFYYSFDHNLDNAIDEFLGYEIFYKFYPEGSATINTDIAALEETYVSTQSVLENRGFVRLRREEDADLPLIPLTGSRKEANIRIRIDFTSLYYYTPPEEPFLTVINTSSGESLEDLQFTLTRPYRTDLPDDPKKFLPEDILSDDPDVVTTGVSSVVAERKPLSVSFCVLAYGRDTNYSLLYSEIVFLNRTSDSALQINL